MSRTARLDSATGFHHITVRGVGRRIIFEDDYDREYFLDTLEKLLDDTGVRVYAWCLMRNHVHILARSKLENVSGLMHRLLTGYSKRFNARHGHVGHVFQNRYDNKPIENDAQFLMTLCYIHQNPIRVRESSAYEYKWSSYREYIQRTQRNLCETELALDMLGGIEQFEGFHKNKMEQANAMLPAVRHRLSDAEAQRTAQALIGPDFGSSIAALPKKERNRQIRILRDHGLTIKQIERLTGIGRNIIQRAK